MDVSDLLAITLKRKVENKGSQMGHTKKIFKKKNECITKQKLFKLIILIMSLTLDIVVIFIEHCSLFTRVAIWLFF